ncbi:eukaryotic rRNA processing protein EBP2-domain-containing protein [Dichotomocladium elegans]|nr:eukaryotic rRNA processing protein EBP2-domain-containing protein [Dichotomocladium elegans]
MGIKKPSKSKLKREAKRKAKEADTQPTIEEQVEETAEQNETEDEETPLAVPIDEVNDQEESAEEDEQNSDEEEAEDDQEDEQLAKVKDRKPINDEEAMVRITENLKLKGLPWIETMTVTSSQPVVIEDINDDMARELAFYQQALEAAIIGREKVLKAGVPFTRPDDYFAEMLKSDEHMAKIRQRLVNEEARMKASEEAKKQRLLKKFGKKVQVEKQLARQKQKTETLEKIKLLKRKRKDGGDLTTNDDFDIALEKADSSPAKKKQKTEKPEKNKKRQAKDAKYGFGGKKRNSKSNTAASSAELGNYNKMKGKALYLGKGKGKGKGMKAKQRK